MRRWKGRHDTGLKVTHPLTGTGAVWIANYVLKLRPMARDWRTAHDERDFGFATEIHLPIKQ